MTKIVTNRGIPDLRYAIESCSGLGFQAEFRGAANNSAMIMQDDNESTWKFSSSAGQFHGLAHSIVSLSAMIDPCTESLKRFIYAPLYQGDMEGEFFVLSAEDCLEKTLISKKDYGDMASFTYQSLQDYISERISRYDQPDFGNNNSRRILGNKGAFLLGRDREQPMFAIRQEFSFEDYDIAHAAGAALEHVKDGDHYLINGTRQTYRDMPNLLSDEGYRILVSRAAMAICGIQDKFNHSRYESDITKVITGEDIVRAIIDGFEQIDEPITPLPHFMKEFGMSDVSLG